MIVTVTMNAALDRTLTVPNLQLDHRHRASASLSLAGGKGINIARALKRLDIPVVATGLAGGGTGTRILEELVRRGDPPRLRPHPRQLAHVDRRRRPDGQLVHGDLRVGAAGRAGRARRAAREAALPVDLRRVRRLRRLAAARCRHELLRGGDPRPEPARDPDRARLGGRAAALGVEAEPTLVSPNQREAEGSSARSSRRRRTSGSRSTASPSWARATC